MSQRVKLGLVAAFVLVDLVLVGLLVRHQQTAVRNAAEEPSPTAAPSATPELKVTGAVELAADDSLSVIVRTRRGSCSGTARPMLERSVDNGKTFQELALPLLEQPGATEPAADVRTVRTVLGVTVRSSQRLTIVAGDDKCDPHSYETNDGGETWKRQDEISGWYVEAAGNGVVSPRGPSEPGCEIDALSSFSATSANVVCSGGRVRSTIDGGLTWVSLGALEELHAAMFTGPRRGHAIATGESCVRSFTSTDGGITWTPKDCVGLAMVRAIAGNESTLVATDGEAFRVSTDGGENWKSP